MADLGQNRYFFPAIIIPSKVSNFLKSEYIQLISIQSDFKMY